MSRRRLPAGWRALGAAALVLLAGAVPAAAQGLDLTQGGPIAITARDGITWLRAQREIIARGNAQAVRQHVTVTANQLIAWYRPKAATPGGAPAASPAGAAATAKPAAVPTTAQGTAPGTAAPGATGEDEGGNEIYRLEAEGNVHIFTPTEHARCDRAIYDLDQSVLVMTGHDLRLVTPNDVLTAKQDLEYWSAKHMAVARGDAVVVTRDARRISADVLVAYTTPAAPAAAASPAGPSASGTSATGATATGAKATGVPVARSGAGAATSTDDPLAATGKLRKVEAFGHVVLRTPTDIVTGDRAVYVPATGMARLQGNVRITRGNNQLAGQAADVNLKTGVATLLSGRRARVQGLIVPDQQTSQTLTNAPGTGGPSPTHPAPPPAGQTAKAPHG
jgi:lipopolysaccharide export system protein LptA